MVSRRDLTVISLAMVRTATIPRGLLLGLPSATASTATPSLSSRNTHVSGPGSRPPAPSHSAAIGQADGAAHTPTVPVDTRSSGRSTGPEDSVDRGPTARPGQYRCCEHTPAACTFAVGRLCPMSTPAAQLPRLMLWPPARLIHMRSERNPRRTTSMWMTMGADASGKLAATASSYYARLMSRYLRRNLARPPWRGRFTERRNGGPLTASPAQRMQSLHTP